VIGLNRRVAERRLSDLPNDLRGSLVLATRTPKAEAEADGESEGELKRESRNRSVVGRAIEIDVEAAYRARLASLGAPPGTHWSPLERAWHFLRSPRAALTRRRLRKNPTPFLVEAARRLVLEAWQGARANDGATRPLLALDLIDLLAAQDAVAAGGELVPGGTRWLADRWDEADVGSRPAG
jgi:hypothetical protein